jgi:hypothetical protein
MSKKILVRIISVITLSVSSISGFDSSFAGLNFGVVYH